MDNMSSFMLVFLMQILLAVECERRCDIRRIYGCMEPKITNENNKGAFVKYISLNIIHYSFTH